MIAYTKEEWEKELKRLKDFFKNTVIPPVGDHKLGPAATAHDLRKAIQTNMVRAEDNIGNSVFLGYLLELQNIEKYIIQYHTEHQPS